MSAGWVKKLNESNSKLYKEDVLKQALELALLGGTSADMFLSLVQACYNPMITFGVKQIPETVNITDAENPWNEFNSLLDQLRLRQLTGHAARDAIEAMSVRFDSEEWNLMCAAVLRKDMRCGFSEKTINKVCKKTKYEVPVFSCQLATSCEGRPEMRGEQRIEPKLDGVRVLMIITNDDILMYSRNGKVFDNFPTVIDSVNNIKPRLAKLLQKYLYGIVLDGEIVGESFQALMKQAQRKTNVNTTDMVYHVFDIIPLVDFERGYWNLQQRRRIEILEQHREILETSCVKIVQGIDVNLDTLKGLDIFRRYSLDAVNSGFEGVMIKSVDAPYESRRTTNWLKFKPVYDYDLKVIGIEEGTGKNIDKMGALICEGTDDGKFIQVNVGSGFTDEQRDEYWQNQMNVIGQTAVILADAVTKNQNNTYSLRFPRFKTFRTDKE